MDQYRLLLEELRRVDALDREGFAKAESAAGGRFVREVRAPSPDWSGLLKSLEAMKADADVDLRAQRHAELQRKFAAASAHFDAAIRDGKISGVQAARVESLMARLAAEAGLA